MKKIAVAVSIMAVTAVLFGDEAKKDDAASQPAQKAEVKTQTTCPVEGGKINKKLFADHEGKRVYFCCGGCLPEFKKDPAKYIKKLEDQGIVLEKTPAKKEETKEAAKAENKDRCKEANDCAAAKTGGCCQ